MAPFHIECYRRFRDVYCLNYQGNVYAARALMIDAARTYETLVNFYMENSHLRTSCNENLKSHLK